MTVALAMLYFVEAMPVNSPPNELTTSIYRFLMAISFGAILKKTKVKPLNVLQLCTAVVISSLAGQRV